MINVCLIGYGKWGKKIYQKTSKVFNYKFIVKNKKSLSTIQLKQVEWVIVATPNKSHFKIVKHCIKNKKNVFCEKPLTLNLHDAKALYKLASKNKVKLIVSDFSEYKKKINFTKNNIFVRTKFSSRDLNVLSKRSDLLYRFAHHDFGLIYDLVKNQKLISIKIYESIKNLNFSIAFKKNNFFFLYDTQSKKKIYTINDKSLFQKKDLIKTMYFDLILNKKKNRINKLKSIFIIKLIEKIKKKIL